MDVIYKLAKWDDTKLIYEVFFKTKKEAEEWIKKHPKEGFFSLSIKEIKTNEEIIKNDKRG